PLPCVVAVLEAEAGRRPALVQLPGRVQGARAEAVRDDTARLLARTPGEVVEPRLRVVGRVDEGLERDVVTGPGLREEDVRRRLRLELRLLAGVEHLPRPVLRLLHVGLVERVDL